MESYTAQKLYPCSSEQVDIEYRTIRIDLEICIVFSKSC